jgi:hypothetical protein
MPSTAKNGGPMSMPKSSLKVKDIRVAAAVLLAFALLTGLSACQRRVAQVSPPLVVVPTPAPPQASVPEPEATPPPATAPGTAATGTSTAVTPPVRTNIAPHKPRGASDAPGTSSAADSPAAAKPPAPQMSPRLSPAEQAAYEERTNENMKRSGQNLDQATGRQLNSTQHDLVEKIRAFLDGARDAARTSDWLRANNLSHKAYVLSLELVSSF